MKTKKIKTGYSMSEVRATVSEAIDQSADRLRRRLRASWKRQNEMPQRDRYEVAV